MVMQRFCASKPTQYHEKDRVLSPKIVLGMMDGPLATSLESYFHDLGWRVCKADSTSEVRRMAHGGRAASVVLPVDAFVGESAFLTCAKLVRSLPKVKVVLVGPDSEESERFALFAGAAGYVPETTSASTVAKLLLGRFVPKPN
jgi:DNA-binding response OmpR family regulator